MRGIKKPLNALLLLTLLTICLPAVADKRVTERFAQYPGDVSATARGLDNLATQYAVIEGKVTCPYKCVFTGFCFKNVNLTLDMKLQSSWKELQARVNQVPDLMQQETNPIRWETQEAINSIRSLGKVFDTTLRGEALEAYFFRQLEETRTLVKNNRDNALALANSLDLSWSRAENQAKSIVSSGNGARKKMQDKVTSDDRCSRGEELTLVHIDVVALSLKTSLEGQMTAIEGYVRPWAGTLRGLAGVAGNTLNQLDGIKESVEPGFTESPWLKIAAESAVDEFLKSEKLSRFWLLSCKDLEACVP